MRQLTSRTAIGLAVSLALCAGAFAREAKADKVSFDITAPSMVQALIQFTEQSGLQLMVPTEGATDVSAPKVVGTLTPADALAQLLAGSSLRYEFANPRTVAIRVAAHPSEASLLQDPAADESFRSPEAAQDNPTSADRDRYAARTENLNNSDSGPTKKPIPEILVKGSRSMDVDIPRSKDDVQPYVILGEKEIEQSQSLNVEDFLKTRLPMNTSSISIDQQQQAYINSGSINLRGLGTNQTLILVDGRRLPGVVALAGNLGQPDISGIPLASVERIEILPTTASGIYGGGATGGVINIIRKKSYSGLSAQAKYGDVFSGSARSVDVNLNGGLTSDKTRTHLVFSLSHSDADPLLVADRTFEEKARRQLVTNNRSALEGDIFAPIGSTANICSADSFGLGFCSVGLSAFGFGPATLLTLKNGTPLNSPIAYVPKGYAGPAADAGAVFSSTAGQYNLEVPRDGQVLLRSPVRDSVSTTFRQGLSESMEAFVDLSASRTKSDLSTTNGALLGFLVPASSSANPFAQDIVVQTTVPGIVFPATSESDLLQGTAGLVAHLPRGWAATIEQGWSRSRTSFKRTTNTALSANEIEALAPRVLGDFSADDFDATGYLREPFDDRAGPFDTLLRSTAIRFSGAAAQLPAGDLTLTAAIERRKATAEDAYETDKTATTFYPHRSQLVESYYLEARVPLVASARRLPLVRSLDVQAAVRRDDYQTDSTNVTPRAASASGPFGDIAYSRNKVGSTDATFGLKYVPAKPITFRASVGTGFLPPELNQITGIPGIVTFPIGAADPLRGGTDAYAGQELTLISGGSPDLSPEDSRSWSAGFVFEPSAIEGLRASLDYTRIKKSREIYQPSASFILQNEDSFPGRVMRGAKLPTDPADWAGPITELDASSINLLSSRVQAYDLQIDYTLGFDDWGTFQLSSVATKMAQFARQVAPIVGAYDSVGFNDGALKWKGQLALYWERGPWAASWNTQYFDSYSVAYSNPDLASLSNTLILGQGSSTIPSQIYHDLQVQFKFSGAALFSSSGLSVALGIQNVFNKSPPIVVPLASALESTGPYGYSTYGDPRMRRFTLTIQTQFGK